MALLCVVGCHTFDPKHPLAGRPSPSDSTAGYRVWTEGNVWHVEASPAGRPHRFQGSLTAVHGSTTELALSRAELRDRVALVGNAVQFDLESVGARPSDGFTVQVAGCARLDLYLDGHRRPDRVRLGPRGLAPRQIPFERCP
jgi:hypothetical protein